MENFNANPESRKLFKLGAILLTLLSIFLVIQIVGGVKSFRYIGQDVVAKNLITVNGDGEVFANPDVATFTFTVMEEGKLVSDAQTKATAKMNAALAALKATGVEEKDIKTVDYNVYPKYEYTQAVCTPFSCPPGKQNLVGYEVSQTISVKVRKVEDAGKILGEMGKANVSNVSGLSFTVDDEDALVREARQKAIEEAREKAKVLANDLGVKLGRVVNFSESGYQPPYFYKTMTANGGRDMAEAQSSAPELPTGQNKITSNVTITYEIR